MIDEDDLPARLHHPRTFREDALGILDQGDDELADDAVESRVGKTHGVRVHHRKLLDEGIAAGFQPLLRPRDHRLRHVDAGDLGRGAVVVEREPRADANLEDAAAGFTRRRGGGAAAAQEHRSAQRVVNRRPAGIGFFHDIFGGIAHEAPSRIEIPSSRTGLPIFCDTAATGRGFTVP